MNKEFIYRLAGWLTNTEFSDYNRPIVKWPKKKFNQTLEQYAKELGVNVSDIPVIGYDKFTGMKHYKGFGWSKKEK